MSGGGRPVAQQERRRVKFMFVLPIKSVAGEDTLLAGPGLAPSTLPPMDESDRRFPPPYR